MEYEWNLLTALSIVSPSKLFYHVIQKNPYPVNAKIIFRHLIDCDIIPDEKIYERLFFQKQGFQKKSQGTFWRSCKGLVHKKR
jgi:hypothetical protein